MCSNPSFKQMETKIIGLPVFILRKSGGSLYPRGPCCPFRHWTRVTRTLGTRLLMTHTSDLGADQNNRGLWGRDWTDRLAMKVNANIKRVLNFYLQGLKPVAIWKHACHFFQKKPPQHYFNNKHKNVWHFPKLLPACSETKDANLKTRAFRKGLGDAIFGRLCCIQTALKNRKITQKGVAMFFFWVFPCPSLKSICMKTWPCLQSPFWTSKFIIHCHF